MPISVTDPIDRAWKRMADSLFRPFNFGKWFGLGFCFFLANFGQGGGVHVNFPMGGGGGGGTPVPPTSTPGVPPGTPGTPAWPATSSGSGHPHQPTAPAHEFWQFVDSAIQWCNDNLFLAIGLAAAGIIVITLLWAVFTWLRCRGIFMVIDNLAFNRGLVVDPWRDTSHLGNNLFWFEFVVGMFVSFFTLLTFIVAGIVAWPDIVNHAVDVNMIWAIIILVVVLPLTGINYGIMQMLLHDFIAPAMYLHDLRTVPAWKRWYRDIFKGHFWKLTLFYLMKIIIGIASGIVAVFATCLTCCIAALPYIGTVILLPIFVFSRCYTLYFIEQFGEPWHIFVYEEGAMPCSHCGYDLRGNPGATHCPECGNPTPIRQSPGSEPWEV